MKSKESSISEQTEKTNFAEAEYRYLKGLNEKLSLFKNDEQSGKNNKQNQEKIYMVVNDAKKVLLKSDSDFRIAFFISDLHQL